MVGVALVCKFDYNLVRQLFIKEEFRFFNSVVVFVQEHLEVRFVLLVYLNFLVDAFAGRFVEFVDYADHYFLRGSPEVADVRDEVF